MMKLQQKCDPGKPGAEADQGDPAVPRAMRAWGQVLRRRDRAGVVPITAAATLRVIRPSDAWDAIGGKPKSKPSRWPRTPRRREAPRPPVRRVRQLLIRLQRDEGG